jgi:hypothetical protein
MKRFIVAMQPHLSSDLRFSEDEWKEVEIMTSILKPFYDATIYMSGGSYPTIPLVVAMAATLKNSLEVELDSINTNNATELNYTSLEHIRPFIFTLRKEVGYFWNYQKLDPCVADLNHAFDALPGEEVYDNDMPASHVFGEIQTDERLHIQLAASLFHPMTKEWTFVSSGVNSKAQEFLLILGKAAIKRRHGRSPIVSAPLIPVVTVAVASSIWSFAAPRAQAPRSRLQIDYDDLEAELKAYLVHSSDLTSYLPKNCSEASTISLFNIPRWWKDHKPYFPRLFEAYCSICCIPASSIPAEELFSLGGRIVTKLRTSLSNERVGQLMFLQSNRRRMIASHLRMSVLQQQLESSVELDCCDDDLLLPVEDI